jgi:hypothetical protein
MERRKRNKILIWIIVLGLANFAAYTVIYWYLQGDASNGAYRDGQYYLRGHFIHHSAGLWSDPVSRATWIYSYVHSISIWPTIAAVLISMSILARPHIIATMSSDSRLQGTTFVTVFITVVTFITAASTLYFVFNFVNALRVIARGGPYGGYG